MGRQSKPPQVAAIKIAASRWMFGHVGPHQVQRLLPIHAPIRLGLVFIADGKAIREYLIDNLSERPLGGHRDWIIGRDLELTLPPFALNGRVAAFALA